MNLEQLIDQFELVTDTEEGLEQLRKLILNLGVRGQLTKQRSNDESVKVLLERIKNTKDQLYKKRKIRKPRSLKPLKDEEIPFGIPPSWKWCKIGDIGKIQGGGTPKTSNNQYWADNGISWLTPADLNGNGKYIRRGRRDISIKGLENSSTFLLPKGTVLFSSRAPIGYVAIANNDLATNQGFQSCIPYVVDMNLYIYYYLKYVGEILDERASGTTFKEVSGTFVANVEFPLPPLEEQQRIVQKIESLFAQVDELEQKVQQDREVDERLQVAVLDDLQRAETPEASRQSWQRLTDHFEQIYRKPENIDQLKQVILNEAVRGRLVPQDSNDEPAEKLLERIKEEKQRLYDEGEIRKPKDLPEIKVEEIPYELPENWKWVRFESVGLTQTGTTPKTSISKYYGDYIPFLGPGDLSNGQIDYNNRALSKLGLEEGRLIPKSSIIMVCIGGSIGKCNIVDRDVSCNQQINTIYPVCDVISELVNQFIRSDYFQDSILNKASGSATPIINRTKWGNLLFPLAPIEEQERIMNKLTELFTWCDDLKSTLRRSRQTDRRLLVALVNGQNRGEKASA